MPPKPVLSDDEPPELFRSTAAICRIELLRRELDPESVAVLDGWLNDKTRYTGTSIGRRLRAKGFTQITDDIVQRHRSGVCKCPKD